MRWKNLLINTNSRRSLAMLLIKWIERSCLARYGRKEFSKWTESNHKTSFPIMKRRLRPKDWRSCLKSTRNKSLHLLMPTDSWSYSLLQLKKNWRTRKERRWISPEAIFQTEMPISFWRQLTSKLMDFLISTKREVK